MRLTSEMREGQAEWAGVLLLVLGSPLLPSRCRRMMRTTESRMAPARLAILTDCAGSAAMLEHEIACTCLWSGPADGTHRLAYRVLDMGAKTAATAAPW